MRHQPDAVAGGEVDRIGVGRLGDVDQHFDAGAIGGNRRFAQPPTRVVQQLQMGGRRLEIFALRLGVGQHDNAAMLGIDEDEIVIGGFEPGDADQHGNATGPRQHRHMARRAAAAEQGCRRPASSPSPGKRLE